MSITEDMNIANNVRIIRNKVMGTDISEMNIAANVKEIADNYSGGGGGEPGTTYSFKSDKGLDVTVTGSTAKIVTYSIKDDIYNTITNIPKVGGVIYFNTGEGLSFSDEIASDGRRKVTYSLDKEYIDKINNSSPLWKNSILSSVTKEGVAFSIQLDRGNNTLTESPDIRVKTINKQTILGEGNIDIGSQSIIFNTDGIYTNLKDEVIADNRNITYSLTTVGDDLLDDLNNYGFSRWLYNTNYSIGSIVTKRDGKIYQSLIDNNRDNDPSNPQYWKEVTFSDSSIIPTTRKLINSSGFLVIDHNNPPIENSSDLSQDIYFDLSNTTINILNDSLKVYDNIYKNLGNIGDTLTITGKEDNINKIGWISSSSGGKDYTFNNGTGLKVEVDNTNPNNPSITYSISDNYKTIIETSDSINNKLINPISASDGNILTYDSTNSDKIVWKSFNPGVPETRKINTDNSLKGGGDLSSDLTLGIVDSLVTKINDSYHGLYETTAENGYYLSAIVSGEEQVRNVEWKKFPDNVGDMTKAIYDPNNKATDAFNMDNMVESSTNKIFTSDERTKLKAIPDKVVSTGRSSSTDINAITIDTITNNLNVYYSSAPEKKEILTLKAIPSKPNSISTESTITNAYLKDNNQNLILFYIEGGTGLNKNCTIPTSLTPSNTSNNPSETYYTFKVDSSTSSNGIKISSGISDFNFLFKYIDTSNIQFNIVKDDNTPITTYNYNPCWYRTIINSNDPTSIIVTETNDIVSFNINTTGDKIHYEGCVGNTSTPNQQSIIYWDLNILPNSNNIPNVCFKIKVNTLFTNL